MREEDRMKFVELANKRVNKAISTIHLIGNLSNRSNYDYADEDVDKIFSAVKQELRKAERRFRAPSEKNAQSFRLE